MALYRVFSTIVLLLVAAVPLARWVRPWMLGGADTDGGWGAGAGAYGQGSLQFVGCNAAYSSRPTTEYLGNRVAAFAITCSIMLPLGS